MGPEAAAGIEVLTAEFFLMMASFEGQFKQHSAALKFFRERCESDGRGEGFILSNSHKAEVAAIIHPPGMEFWFDHADMRVWSWWELVAQMDEESIRDVVEDGDSSRGLVGCEFRPRTGSYDHSRQVQPAYGDRAQLRCWDFILRRSDGTAVRLHPEWTKTTIPTFAVEGQGVTQLPRNGLGLSDGHGTFSHYRNLGRERLLKFARRRASV